MPVDVGAPITRNLTVTVNGTLTDPTTITFTVRSPTLVDTLPTVTRLSVGQYTAVFIPDAAGIWRYRWATTGPGAGVDEGTVTVTESFTAASAGVTEQDVADVIPRRATDGGGLASGTFTDQTSPTADQVRRVAGRYWQTVTSRLGGTIPPALEDEARAVAAMGAAAQIELAFFPETADTVSKPLFARFDGDLARLIAEAERLSGQDLPGGTDGKGYVPSPLGDFPSVTEGIDERIGVAGAGGWGPFYEGGPVDDPGRFNGQGGW